MSNPNVHEKEGSLDDFIDNLVSAPPQAPSTYRLINEESNLDTVFNILVEIFTKVMKYVYSDRTGKVNLDSLDESAYSLMSKYFNSFGFNIYLDKIEGTNKVSFGTTEDTPIRGDELKAKCLRIKTQLYQYVIYFDILK
jgi:hypothetical protein